MLRFTPPRSGDPSPWGVVDAVTPLGPDAVVVATASHGGVWVRPAALQTIPEPLRETAFSRNGWFEEDSDWCIPYLALDLHRFEANGACADRNLAAAHKTLWRRHRAFASVLGFRAPVDAQDVVHG